MADFDKYFNHIEGRKEKKQEDLIKWEALEDQLSRFFPEVVTPALEEIDNKNKRLQLVNSGLEKKVGVSVGSYDIEIRDVYSESEGRFNLKVTFNQYLDVDNLEILLVNLHTDNEVELITTTENMAKDDFKDKLEEIFIELYDKDNS